MGGGRVLRAAFGAGVFVAAIAASAGPVQVPGGGGSRAGGNAAGQTGSTSPLEKKCLAGFSKLMKWKSEYARKVSDADSADTCTAFTYDAERDMPPPPVQCQYLTYGESSSKLQSALSSFTGESGPGKNVKMSAAYGEAMRGALRKMIDKCDQRAMAAGGADQAESGSKSTAGGGTGRARSGSGSGNGSGSSTTSRAR